MSETNKQTGFTGKRVTEPITLSYKEVDGSPILLDIFPPRSSRPSTVTRSLAVPAVVYFHGGGLAVGNRKSWFPYWLEERVTSAGIAFISADYSLIPPSTGHDLVKDIKDLFEYLALRANASILEQFKDRASGNTPFEIDPGSIGVAGTSAGGLCAYLAVVHATPKPKALLALYAMGGDFIIPHYLTPKTEVFFRGRELLDPRPFSEYLPPRCHSLQTTSDSPLAYYPASSPIPGYPANQRMLLARLYLQLGNFLDFYTGKHGLSAVLRTAFSSTLSSRSDPGPQHSVNNVEDKLVQELDRISPEVSKLFPQLNVSSSWPPCLFVHGSADSAVPIEESQHIHDLLNKANVPVSMKVVPNREHSFDYAPEAEEVFGVIGGLFDEVQSFFVHALCSQ